MTALALFTTAAATAQIPGIFVHGQKYDQHGNLLDYSDFPPATDAEWKIQNLYSGYRTYYLVKFCYEERDGFASVFINDVQLEKARLKAKDLETDAKAANPDLDVDALWKRAVANSKGYMINYPSCQGFYLALFRLKSSHGGGSDAPGDAAKKDF